MLCVVIIIGLFWVLAIVSAVLIIWKRCFEFIPIPAVLLAVGIIIFISRVFQTQDSVRTMNRAREIYPHAEAGDPGALNELTDILVKNRIRLYAQINSDLIACQKLLGYCYSGKLDAELKRKCLIIVVKSDEYSAMVELGSTAITSNDKERIKWLKRTLVKRENASVLYTLARLSECVNDENCNAIGYYRRAIAAYSDTEKHDKAYAMYMLALLYNNIQMYIKQYPGSKAERKYYYVTASYANYIDIIDYDVKDIIELFVKASEFVPNSFVMLARIYHDGIIIPQDLPKCVYYHERAIRSDQTCHPYVSYDLAKILMITAVTLPDTIDRHKYIRSLLKMSANKKHALATFELAEMYHHGGNKTKKCAKKALRLYKEVYYMHSQNIENVYVKHEIKLLTQVVMNQAIVITFLLGHNPRVGRESPLQILPPPVLYDISNMILDSIVYNK